MAKIPVDVAELVGCFVECILYGIAVVLYGIALYVLIHRRTTESVNKSLVIASTVMIFLCTARISLDLQRIAHAFLKLDAVHRIGFLNDITQQSYAAKNSIYVTQAVIGDIIMIWRAFVVWRRNFWVVILPLLLSIGSIVCGYGTIYIVRRAIPGQLIFIGQATRLVIAFLSLSLAANTVAALLIAYRIYRTNTSHAPGGGRASLWPVVVIVIESGAVNACYLLSYIICQALKTNGNRTVSDMATPIVSIVFTSVVVRVAMRVDGYSSRDRSRSYGGTSAPYSKPYTPNVSRNSRMPPTPGGNGGERMAMTPLEINVSKYVQRDDGIPSSTSKEHFEGLDDTSEHTQSGSKQYDPPRWEAV